MSWRTSVASVLYVVSGFMVSGSELQPTRSVAWDGPAALAAGADPAGADAAGADAPAGASIDAAGDPGATDPGAGVAYCRLRLPVPGPA